MALLPPDPGPLASPAAIDPPARPADDLYTVVSSDPSVQYDVRDLLAAILDGGRLDEYRPEYGRTIVCGFGSLGGIPLGIVATQRLRFRPEGGGPFQFGGVIYADSADKAARFVLDCNQSRLPILFIQDVNGFDVGRDAERTGIIRRGAKLVSAVSNSTVPKITLIVGHSFGAGHYALCGKAFDPRFIFAWPGARYAVMGASQAARTMLDVNVGTLKRQGKQIDDAELAAMAEELRLRYDRETDIRYAAARLWVDAIIDPAKTREVLSMALDVAVRNRELKPRVHGSLSGLSALSCQGLIGRARKRRYGYRISARIGEGDPGHRQWRRLLGRQPGCAFLARSRRQIDVLTLEYLAELTMAISEPSALKDPARRFRDRLSRAGRAAGSDPGRESRACESSPTPGA